MTRRMSCSLTVDAVRARTKTVTRRHVDTWATLKVGDRLTLVEKGMGLPKGARQVVLADVEITEVRVEPLRAFLHGGESYTEIEREGFDWKLGPTWFINFWLDSHHCARHTDPDVRRIEWRYLRVLCPLCRNQFDGRMPGHHYGSNWDWVPCQTCNGDGMVDA